MARTKQPRRKATTKRAKKTKGKIGGPFLAAAVFCESILEDKDGKMSAVGMVDSLSILVPPDAPPDIPSREHPLPHTQLFLLTLKSGSAGGKHLLELRLTTPSGEKKAAGQYQVDLAPVMHGGISIRSKVGFEITEPGLYVLDVKLDGRQLTRCPFNVNVERLRQKQVRSAKQKKSTVKPIT